MVDPISDKYYPWAMAMQLTSSYTKLEEHVTMDELADRW
jgi:hypothetical protein